MIYKVEIELDSKTGELVLPFPQGLVDAMGWTAGDKLIWEETAVLEDDKEYKGFAIWRQSDD
jgi:hypothetical protein